MRDNYSRKNFCAFCVNKGDSCDKCSFQLSFCPNDEVKPFFEEVRPKQWTLSSDESKFATTRSIKIGNRLYCPYCGGEMFEIPGKTLPLRTSYCCICEGARAEVAFKKGLEKLQVDYDEGLQALKNTYAEKLVFCKDKLIDIKHHNEMRALQNEKYDYFSEIDGVTLTDISQF